MAKGTHEYQDDPRNAEILIYVNGELVPRTDASISVFDSGFVLGDGVWEGLRLHRGRILFLDHHLDRLYAGARALDFEIGLDREALSEALYRTVGANSMRDHVHIRLMVTRGLKSTPYQDPRVTVGAATIVIIAEHKQPDPAVIDRGVRFLGTAAHDEARRHVCDSCSQVVAHGLSRVQRRRASPLNRAV